MNFDRKWTAFALEAEAEAYGFTRIAAAHNRLLEQALAAAAPPTAPAPTTLGPEINAALARRQSDLYEGAASVTANAEASELSVRAEVADPDDHPFCRDCADHEGTCPHDGHKCGE